MNDNVNILKTIQLNDVPWNRMSSFADDSSELPKLLEKLKNDIDSESVLDSLEKIEKIIEKDNKLCQSTPFALVFLIDYFGRMSLNPDLSITECEILDNLKDFFEIVVDDFMIAEEKFAASKLNDFSEMISEKYLSVQNNQKSVFSDEVVFSFYYYSYKIIVDMIERLKHYENFLPERIVTELSEII